MKENPIEEVQTMTDYPNHPASELFPMMTDDEMSKLTQDIKEHGLLEPIVLHEGKVLDGRNRQIACRKARKTPRYLLWNGEHGSPIYYVLARNLYRRNLTTSQRQAIAADSIPLLEQEAKKHSLANLKRGPEVTKSPHRESTNAINDMRGKVRDIAAKAFGVGGTGVQKALAVKRADPEEHERVKRGETTVEKAYRKIRGKQPQEKSKFLTVSLAARIESIVDGLDIKAQKLGEFMREKQAAKCAHYPEWVKKLRKVRLCLSQIINRGGNLS